MKQYTCIVLDDQEESVNLIKDHIKQIPQLSLIHVSTKPIEVLDYLDNTKPDIMFLDVQMPEFTGIDLVENMKERWGHNIPKVVLTTGHLDYTLNGYELGVADYILKPVTFKRFKKSVDRIMNDLDQHAKDVHSTEYFFADIDGKKLKINFGDILYIEAARNYIILVMEEKKHILYKSMNSAMEILPENKFIRVHKSYILAIDKIESVRGSEFQVERKNNKISIPIGVTFKKKVLKRLNIS